MTKQTPLLRRWPKMDESRCPVCNGVLWPHNGMTMYCPNCCKYYDMAADGGVDTEEDDPWGEKP